MIVQRSGAAFYGLTVLIIAISIAVLFRLQTRFENSQEQRVADLQRVFSNRDLMKTPSDFKIVFSEIESEVAKYENRGEFGPITLSKKFGKDERIVYPFYLPALESLDGTGDQARLSYGHPLPGAEEYNGEKVRALPLISDGVALGTLWVVVKQGALRNVSQVIWALSALLAATMALLALQFRRQEKVISRTTIELENKRRELVRLERLALAGQLSANVLHDLKKPVLNIKNEAREALAERDIELHSGVPLGSSADPSLKSIVDQTQIFFEILREGGIDKFVRAQEEHEYVDLNEMLDRSLALVRYERRNVNETRDYAPALPPVLGSPVRFIQVFSNLILNAYQAMDGRGSLAIRTRGNESEKRVIVEIEDNGPGIPPEKLTSIFDPFFTTKAPGEGTGLGLYIAREIVAEMKGELMVESKPGQTLFQILLPFG